MLLKELSALTSPLSQTQVDKLTQFTSELNPVQLAWVSGYLAASASANHGKSAVAKEPTTEQVMTILYGSQTGNGRGVAEALAAKASAQGIAVNLVSMADYKTRQLKQERLLLLVVSTHGEGEAPDDAIELHQFLSSKRAPKLNSLKFSVLALGDASYEFFCQTGKEFQERLLALGATSLVPLQQCDVDYEQHAEQWQTQVLAAATPHIQPTSAAVIPLENTRETTSSYSKQQPYTAEVISNQKLTGRDSDRNVCHVEIDLAESGITYQAGDALGVWFSNSATLVDELIAQLGLSAEAVVIINDETLTLRNALLTHREITQVYPGLIEAWADYSGHQQLLALRKDKSQLRQFMLQNQLIDLVENFPVAAEITATALVELLRPLTPRLYSIASSQAEVESEVHLTVALAEAEHQGVVRHGGASQFLTHAEEGQALNVYVEPNKNFRLPPESETPVIMIGPGTGVAPFRAFMQQRSAEGATGKSWLFFGNPHFEQDFLYQTEWQQYLKQGELTRLDVAFSRDQQHKVYVQDKIKLHGAEIWQWLSSGAHLYICGDAQRMAKDVHQALLDVIQEFGEMQRDGAETYLAELRSNHRYQKDVY